MQPAVRGDPRSTCRCAMRTPMRRSSCRSARSTTRATSARSASAASAAAVSARPRRSCSCPTNIKAKVNQVLMFEGLERKPVDEAEAGDIVLINGIDEVGIGATLCDLEHPEALPRAQGRRADADDELPGQRLAARRTRGQVRHQPPDPRAPRARDARATSRCASSTPPTPTPSSCTAAASCTSPSCSRTCGAKATRSRCRGRA